MANARFLSLGGGLVAELIATTTIIRYNPTTGGAVVNFTGKPFIKPDQTYISVSEQQDTLEVDLSEHLLECPIPANAGFLDPITGVDLGLVSYQGVMGIIKFVYDKEYNIRESLTPRSFFRDGMGGRAGVTLPVLSAPKLGA